MARTVEDDTSGQLHKKKKKRKNQEKFEKNVPKFSFNFRNNLCAKKYQPQMRYSTPPLKFQKRPAPWIYNNSKVISAP